MSAKPGKTKDIQDHFSLQQPGQINVAGEIFFLNLPGENTDTITSRLFDDSIKGDTAFQILFLGGKAKEDGGPLFTRKEQEDLRRIFRAIFGPKESSLPTKAQLATVGRRLTGKSGIAMPIKGEGLQLPCSMEDRKLMVKAIESRRRLLIQHIQNYDTLAASDIHARQIRDHLKRLNTLLEQEIPNTKANCRPTAIVDPDAPAPLSLSDERMHRLLEIFAYLLAQGETPTRALRTRYPDPTQVLTSMAQPDAPDIYQYEESYTAENPGKTPKYTDTLLKIRKVLEGDAALSRAVVSADLVQALVDIEDFLGITDKSGSYRDRKDRIVRKLTALQKEISDADADISGLKAKMAVLQKELQDVKNQKKLCDDELATLKKGGVVPKAEKDALEAEKATLLAKIAALEQTIKDKDAELLKLQGVEKELEALKLAKAAVDGQVGNLTKELADLRAKSTAELDALRTQVDDLTKQLGLVTTERDTLLKEGAAKDTQIKDLTDEVTRLKAELSALRAELATRITAEEAQRLRDQITALQADLAKRPTAEEAQRLRDQITALQADLATRLTADQVQALRDQITDLETRNRDLETQVARIAGLEQQVRDLTAERDNFRGLYNALVEAAGEGGLTPERVRQLIDTAGKVPGLEADLKAARDEVASLTAQLAAALAAGGEVAKLRADLAAAQSEVTRLTAQVAEEQAAKAALQQRADAAEARVAELEAEVAAARNEIAALNARVLTAEENLQRANDRIQELEADLAEARRIGGNIAALRAELAAEKAAKEAAEAERDEARRQLEALRVAKDEEIAAIQAQLAAAINQRDSIRTKLIEAEKAKTRLASDNRSLIDELTGERATSANLRSQLTRCRSLFRKINEFLVTKDVPPLPNNFDDATIDDRIRQLEAKFVAAQVPPPEIVNESIYVCMLNILYNLFRNVYITHGTPWSGVTDPGKFRQMFRSIESAAEGDLNESIITVFMGIMKTLKIPRALPNPDESLPLIFDTAEEREKYRVALNTLRAIHRANPIFTQENRDMASYILRDFIPNQKSFTRYSVDDDLRIRNKGERMVFDLNSLDISTVFLYLFSLTKKILDAKADVLTASGCDVNLKI